MKTYSPLIAAVALACAFSDAQAAPKKKPMPAAPPVPVSGSCGDVPIVNADSVQMTFGKSGEKMKVLIAGGTQDVNAMSAEACALSAEGQNPLVMSCRAVDAKKKPVVLSAQTTPGVGSKKMIIASAGTVRFMGPSGGRVTQAVPEGAVCTYVGQAPVAAPVVPPKKPVSKAGLPKI